MLDKNGDGFVTAEEARDFFAGSDERCVFPTIIIIIIKLTFSTKIIFFCQVEGRAGGRDQKLRQRYGKNKFPNINKRKTNTVSDGNGSLDKSEFRAMWEFLKGGSEELEAIREDFQRLDLDGNGYISRVSQENTLMFPGKKIARIF